VKSLFIHVMFRGWTAIINDNFIATTFVICRFLTTGLMFSAGFGVGYYKTSASDYSSLLGFIAAGVGLSASMVVFDIVESATSMVFVCLAECPRALQRSHPETYAVLDYTWTLFHPDIQEWRIPPVKEQGGYVAPVCVLEGGSVPVAQIPENCQDLSHVSKAEASAANSFSYL
jgi:hypothetical protein